MKLKKGKKTIVVLIIVVLAVIVIFALVRPRKSKREMMQTPKEQTETVVIQDLSKSIGATGTVVSKKKKSLSVSLNDTLVTKVYVEEGDSVKKGDLLMEFDVSDAAQNLEDAKESLANAQARNSLSADDAARNVSNAETTRKQQLKSAKDNKESAKKDYEDAKEAYQKEKKKLETLKGEEEKAKADYEQSNTPETKAVYEAAVTAEKQQEQTVATAKQQMEAAKKTYSTQKNAYEQTVTSQNNSVANAKSNQKSTQLSADTSSMESQVRQYQEQYDKGILKAPYDGIITAINYEEEDIYNGGTAVELQDCSEYEIETEIGEYDICNVEVGQKVLIKTDATGDEEMTGKVTKIAVTGSNSGDSGSTSTMSGATASGSDVTYSVRIAFDQPQENLKLDMSASLSIILEQHRDALTVPYNAIQTKDDGTCFVTVVSSDGAHKDIPITILMESNYYTEIEADIKEGDNVVVIAQEESTETTFGPGGQGGPMGGGGF